MDQLVWCVNCQRVWRNADLTGTWPALTCPDVACNGGRPGAFMPYHQTRRMMAQHWPAAPTKGQRVALKPGPSAGSGTGTGAEVERQEGGEPVGRGNA